MIQAVRTATRPRIEGEREHAIFDATMRMLATSGYDRLTMDAVAAEARASKATLYRRWQTKADLVVDALVWLKSCMPHRDARHGSCAATCSRWPVPTVDSPTGCRWPSSAP